MSAKYLGINQVLAIDSFMLRVLRPTGM